MVRDVLSMVAPTIEGAKTLFAETKPRRQCFAIQSLVKGRIAEIGCGMLRW